MPNTNKYSDKTIMAKIIETYDDYKGTMNEEDGESKAEELQKKKDKILTAKEAKANAIEAKQNYEEIRDSGKASEKEISIALLKFKKFAGKAQMLAAEVKLEELGVQHELEKEKEKKNEEIQNRNNESINEQSFSRFSKISTIEVEIDLDVDVEHSAHSMERQSRSSTRVTNADIKEAVDLASDKIIENLINNTIDIGDDILIVNRNNDLNVVGSMLYRRGNYIFKVITVMFKRGFKAKPNTFKITV